MCFFAGFAYFQGVFFLVEFLLVSGNKDKSSRTHRKDFCETKKMCQSQRGKKNLKLSYLTQWVPVSSSQNIA
jgi:hypothetical protein